MRILATAASNVLNVIDAIEGAKLSNDFKQHNRTMIIVYKVSASHELIVP